MVERICPQCQAGNSLENRFCGQCGAPLDRTDRALPGAEQQRGLVISGPLPAHLKQVGQAMLVSLAALAAEAGMAWLRRRVETLGQPSHPATRTPTSFPIVQGEQPGRKPFVPGQPADLSPGALGTEPEHSRVTVWSQRVVEFWEQGECIRQTVDRRIWRWEKE